MNSLRPMKVNAWLQETGPFNPRLIAHVSKRFLNFTCLQSSIVCACKSLKIIMTTIVTLHPSFKLTQLSATSY